MRIRSSRTRATCRAAPVSISSARAAGPNRSCSARASKSSRISRSDDACTLRSIRRRCDRGRRSGRCLFPKAAPRWRRLLRSIPLLGGGNQQSAQAADEPEASKPMAQRRDRAIALDSSSAPSMASNRSAAASVSSGGGSYQPKPRRSVLPQACSVSTVRAEIDPADFRRFKIRHAIVLRLPTKAGCIAPARCGPRGRHAGWPMPC